MEFYRQIPCDELMFCPENERQMTKFLAIHSVTNQGNALILGFILADHNWEISSSYYTTRNVN